MMKTVRRIAWILAALVLVVVVGWAIKQYFFSGQSAAVQYDTAKVQRGDVVARVTATGTLSALVTVQVGSQVSGRVKDIYVDFNSQVTKGQKLAKIDPQSFQAAIAQAHANYTAATGNLARAQASLVNAKLQYERNQQLAAKNLIAQADLDTSKASYLMAEADVQSSKGSLEQAAAAVNNAQINLGYTDIVSPVDGVVISRAVDVGQTVAASLQAPVLFTIAEDLRKMQVDTSVAEADVGRLEPGMNATFTVDAFPNMTFKGTVRQIRNSPVTVQNVVTYDAVIDVDNPDLKLRPGMTATVTFVCAERKNVLKIPNAALRYRPPTDLTASAGPAASGSGRARAHGGSPDGGTPRAAGSSAPDAESEVERRVVWVLRGTTPERVPVKIGLTDGTTTELVEGNLQEGDALVTGTSVGGTGATTQAGGQTGRPPGGGMRRMF